MKICRVEKKKEVIDVDYEVCETGYCCEKMKEHLDITRYHGRKNLWYDTDAERFIIRVKNRYDGYSSGDEDRAIDEDLYFCPFCGIKLQEPKIIAVEIPKKIKKKLFGKKK